MTGASTLPPLATTTTVCPAKRSLWAMSAASAAEPPGSTTSLSVRAASRIATRAWSSVTSSPVTPCRDRAARVCSPTVGEPIASRKTGTAGTFSTLPETSERAILG